jgi:hypothetical protein
MRVRAENPHDLPPRMYERQSARKITWWSKAADGTTRVLRSVPRNSDDARIETARAAAISLHSVAHGRQKRADTDTVATWIANAGIAEKEAVRVCDGLPAWALRLFKDSKRRAGGRAVVWSLTLDQFAAITARSAGFCEVSGVALSLTATGQKGPYGPSIDRIRSDRGYTVSNVRIVCVAVNFALNAWGLEAFLPVARALVARHSYSNDGNFGI